MGGRADILAALRADIAAIEQGDGEAAANDSACVPAGTSQSPQPEPGRGARSASPRARAGAADPSAAGEAAACGKTADEAFRKILRWASVRERSSAYVRERLLRDEFSEQAADEALERAIRVRAVDDRRYADALVRTTLAAGRGLRRAEEEIRGLGIHPEELESWTEHQEAGRDAEVGRALEVLRRRPPRARAAREAAFRKLVGQGYSTDVASTAARLWSEGAASA